MAAQHDHAQFHSEVSDRSRTFHYQYRLDPLPFDIGCAWCCWEFLTVNRQYGTAQDARTMVKFGNANTSCYVKDQGVKTGHLNLGRVARPFAASLSYQLYGQAAGGLGVCVNMTVRIEAISMPVLKVSDVQDCYFNYADAALLELYRLYEGELSFKGQCCWPTQEQEESDCLISGPLSELKIKEENEKRRIMPLFVFKKTFIYFSAQNFLHAHGKLTSDLTT